MNKEIEPTKKIFLSSVLVFRPLITTNTDNAIQNTPSTALNISCVIMPLSKIMIYHKYFRYHFSKKMIIGASEKLLHLRENGPL